MESRAEAHPRGRTLLIWAGMFLLAYMVSLGAHLALLPQFDGAKQQWFGGERLLANPDGYYFLRHAADWGAGDYGQPDPLRPGMRPRPVPPLSAIAAVAAYATGLPMERVAFFLPPVLAALGCAIGLIAGALAGSRLLGLMAAVFMITSEAWFSRAALGGFDTDCLLPQLLFGLIFSLYKFDRGHAGWGLAALGLTGGLHLWWPQAGLFFAAAAWGLYALGGVIPGGRLRRTRVAVVALTLGGAFAWLAFGPHLPHFIRAAIDPLDQHLRFALGKQPSVFIQTGWSVEELAGMPFLEALSYLSGHWVLGATALAGLIGFSVWRPRLGFYLGLPSLCMFAASMYLGNRFAMYAVMVHAIGLAWVCAVLLPWLFNRFKRTGLAASWCACAAIMAWCLSGIYAENGLTATFTTNQVALAKQIDQVAGPDAAVWNWWGPGYMVQYYARRETFFDGGLQGPERAFISAAPLACDDPLLARNWIKFFSVHPAGLKLLKRAGGYDKSVGFLRQVFADPARLDELVAEYGLDPAKDWRSLLFPRREVYLILYSEMIMRNSWLKIGLWDDRTRTSPDTPMYALPLTSLAFDRKRGLMITGQDNVVPYSKLLFIAPDSLSHDNPREHGPVALLFKNTVFGYVIPEEFFDALAFRLLFIYPDTTPGFELVKYNPFVGGVWRVH